MTAHLARLRDSRSWWFDLSVFVLGVATFGVTLGYTGLPGWEHHLLVTIVAVPLIMVMARFPMVLDNGRYGVEVGFDSTVLMFLLCTFETHDALIAWSVGVIVTQATTGKRLASKLFNIGVGILAGSYAGGLFELVGSRTEGTPRELVAVALAAACYFTTDFVLSALSVAIATGSGVRSQLFRRGTVLAVACFVPFDLLGYLAAVVHRTTPWWMLSLLVIPLLTLLIATRALTRGREHARRLTVLFDAAVRAQTLTDPDQVVEALLDDARALVRLSDVPLRPEPPAKGEIGARVERGGDGEWIVARATDRARSTVAADEQALRALAAVASEAFGRIELTADRVHVARHDPLTDLPNRGILLDRLEHALDLSRRRGTRVALLFIDLDGFKPINDRFGHSAGDAVLVELADRLLACVRSSDTVARLGGDEFAVLFEDVDDDEDLEAACARVLEAVNSGVELAGQPVHVGASIGLAHGDGGVSAAALLRNADLAMYEAKARGKAQIVRYEDSIGRARLDRLELIDALSRAIEAREIEVHYQPVVDSATGRILGAEALARWRRDGVPVPPDVFIPVAEETGQIMALGDLVLETVVADSATLREAAVEPVQLGINVSPRQLREPAFVESVRRALDAMAGTTLVLEITEREGINADCGVLDAMHALADLGVRFAIDDFGVGFSSISYLHDLPAHVIKLDATLSRDMDRDERSDALLRSVTLMGRTLGLEVVVEGIERETQLAMLRDGEHPVLAQGYLLHRPMPVSDLVDVLQDAGLAGDARTAAPADTRERPVLAPTA